MPRAGLVLAVAAALSSCSGCEKKAVAGAGSAAVIDAGARPPDRDEWWVSLPDLPEGAHDLEIATLKVEGPPERQWAWLMRPFCDQLADEKEADPKSLRCGRAVYEQTADPRRRYAIQFNRTGHRFMPLLFAVPTRFRSLAELEPLLTGFHHEKLGAFDGLCQAFEPGVTACKGAESSGQAIALSDGFLISGRFDELEEFLQAPVRYWVLTELEAVSAHFEAIDPAAEIELDLFPRGTSWMIGPRRWLPYTREESEPLSRAVRQNARAVGWETAWDEGRGAIILVPRCSTTACPEREALAQALRTYHAAWAPAAPERMERFAEELGKSVAHCGVHERAIIDAAARAQVAITPHGTIELRYATDGGFPDPADCAPELPDNRAE